MGTEKLGGKQVEKKLAPIVIDKALEISKVFDECHIKFKETIATKDRPLFNGMEIYVPLKWIENKAELFWHSASIELKDKLDIKPCTMIFRLHFAKKIVF